MRLANKIQSMARLKQQKITKEGAVEYTVVIVACTNFTLARAGNGVAVPPHGDEGVLSSA